ALGELTDTVTSQGVAAVARKPSWPVAIQGVVVIADEIQDPGNLGTLLRTAAAVGAQGLFVVKGSVDPYSPKVLRASMGAVFQLPHWLVEREELLRQLRKSQTSIVVADLQDADSFWNVTYP